MVRVHPVKARLWPLAHGWCLRWRSSWEHLLLLPTSIFSTSLYCCWRWLLAEPPELRPLELLVPLGCSPNPV